MSSNISLSVEIASGIMSGIAIAHLWKNKLSPLVIQLQERRKVINNQGILEYRSREIDELVEQINEFTSNLDTKAIASITEGTATYEGVAKLYGVVRSLVETVNALVLNLRVASQKADIPTDSLPPLFSEPTPPEGSDRKKRKP